MLKQILHDMYIEPELLAELNEPQKQILFFKIREEQVRRWRERESQEQSPTRPPRKKESRGVRWLLGSDGDVWVWVMGEAAGDRPFGNIMNQLMEKRARRQAHEDAQEISRVQQEEMEMRFRRDTLAKQKACLLAGKWRSEVVNKDMKKQAGEEKQVLEAQGKVNKHHWICHHQNCEEDEQSESKGDTCTTDKPEDGQHETEDSEWQEQLRRSKAADEEMKSKALRAREECKRHSLRALETSLIALRFHASFMNAESQSRRRSTALDANVTDSSSSVCPRPDRPTTRESIIHWFRAEQQPKQAGYERNSNSIAPWFHGLISRQEAECLLSEQPEGSFLLRVSECIWGFTLSYRTAHAFKHFLVDASADYYSFIGLDQIQHATLDDLVSFHREEVITTSGMELLQHACPPRSTSTHYGGLFE